MSPTTPERKIRQPPRPAKTFNKRLRHTARRAARTETGEPNAAGARARGTMCLAHAARDTRPGGPAYWYMGL